MGRSRKARRRAERARAKRVPTRRGLSITTRILIAGAGILAAGAGVALLVNGTAGNAERLSRVAGIMILLGIIAVIVAIVGKL